MIERIMVMPLKIIVILSPLLLVGLNAERERERERYGMEK